MFEVVISDQAEDRLGRLPTSVADDIVRKIAWLAANALAIRHEYMKGRDEASLHIGQYRVLYLIDWTAQMITIVDIDKHDEAYRRLQRR